MTVRQFFVDQIRDCRVHVWPNGRQQDKLVDRYSVISKSLKYRKIQDTNEIQESTGQLQKIQEFTGPLGSLLKYCSMPSFINPTNGIRSTGILERRYCQYLDKTLAMDSS